MAIFSCAAHFNSCPQSHWTEPKQSKNSIRDWRRRNGKKNRWPNGIPLATCLVNRIESNQSRCCTGQCLASLCADLADWPGLPPPKWWSLLDWILYTIEFHESKCNDDGQVRRSSSVQFQRILFGNWTRTYAINRIDLIKIIVEKWSENDN